MRKNMDDWTLLACYYQNQGKIQNLSHRPTKKGSSFSAVKVEFITQLQQSQHLILIVMSYHYKSDLTRTLFTYSIFYIYLYLIVKRQNFSPPFFHPPPTNYPDSGEFIPSHFFYFSNRTHALHVSYVTRTHDPYSYKLEQLVSRDDKYGVWFQYVLSHGLCILYVT
jgi:hypothetical protein